MAGLTYLSLFTGVGGADLGFDAAGWTPVAQVEVDPHCRGVLAHHWPDTPRYTDVRDYDGALHPADVVTGGFPCQDVSLAGKRAGVLDDGTRSNLYVELIRIVKEMRDATDGLQPRWVVLENVRGLLSVDEGHGFARVLDDLAHIGAVGIEWCLLDTQFFGPPQRRQRIFIVACLDPATARRSPDPLLPVTPGVPGDPGESSEERPATAPRATTGVAGGRKSNERGITTALTSFDGMTRPDLVHADAGWLVPVSPAVTSKWAKGTGGPAGDECQNLVPVQIPLPPTMNDTVAGTLGSSHGDAGMSADLDRTGLYVAVAFAENQRGEVRTSDTVPSISQVGGKPGQGYQAIATFAIQPADQEGGQGAIRLVETDLAPTIAATDGAKSTDRGLRVAYPNSVRRITPIEAERLQGWPDDHTARTADGPQSDTVRYKQIGNGISSPVARWVAEQINRAEEAP